MGSEATSDAGYAIRRHHEAKMDHFYHPQRGVVIISLAVARAVYVNTITFESLDLENSLSVSVTSSEDTGQFVAYMKVIKSRSRSRVAKSAKIHIYTT